MRGYNQAELIARAVTARVPSLAVRTDIVQKIRHTAQQAKTASRAERLENLADAFCATVSVQTAANYSMVIIDDVATTGASIAAVRAALRAVGYTHIHAVTIAH
jgi:predicted amidophosphoribosyltransferase